MALDIQSGIDYITYLKNRSWQILALTLGLVVGFRGLELYRYKHLSVKVFGLAMALPNKFFLNADITTGEIELIYPGKSSIVISHSPPASFLDHLSKFKTSEAVRCGFTVTDANDGKFDTTVIADGKTYVALGDVRRKIRNDIIQQLCEQRK